MTMRAWGAVLGAVMLGTGGVALLGGYRAGAFPAGPPAEKGPDVVKARQARAARREEEQAVRKAVRAYCDAFNKGDLDALAASWAADAEYTGADGKTVRGRAAIRDLLRGALAAYKGGTLSLQVRGLRVVAPDVVSEDGTALLTTAAGAVEPDRYAALWVKKGGRWLLSSVRDLPAAEAVGGSGAFAMLKPLAWMVGEWKAKDGRDVRLTCRWGFNQTFLIQDFAWKVSGTTVHSTQRIGWDAHNGRVRSWVFDSAGGFGEGFWKRQGNTWEVLADGVFPDGRVASSVSRWAFIDENTVRWSATDRQADETPMPDLAVTFVRSTPAPVSAPGRSKP
jgi:uncharacterized protein (TIGR02246 family)